MPPKSKAPTGQARASRESCGGWSQPLPTLDAYRVQFLTLAYAIQPDRAVMLAALAFGGGND